MVGEIASRHALSDEMIDGVSERTGGVPLFVEEVTRLLLERGEQGGAQAIPPTLQQSLAARLDRLGEAREVAQIGAVLGRDFSYRLLSDVSRDAGSTSRACKPRWIGSPKPTSCSSTARRHEADLPLQARADPGRGLRQPAQEPPPGAASPRRRNPARQPSAQRRAGSRSPIISPRPASTISRSNGGARRATRLLRRSAFQEAIAHLGKAIAMADKAGGATARRGVGDAAAASQRLKLQTDYGQARDVVAGASPPTRPRPPLRAPRSSRRRTDDFSERFAAFYGQWDLAYRPGRIAVGAGAGRRPSCAKQKRGAICRSRRRSPNAWV